MAKKISDDLINNGKVERGWLGVGIQSVTPELAGSFNSPYMKGSVIVNNVNDKTPALSAGIKQGDIITQFDGQPVTGTKNFQQLVINSHIGKTVPIKIFRDGAEKTIPVKIGQLED
jgi:serine protease Do